MRFAYRANLGGKQSLNFFGQHVGVERTKQCHLLKLKREDGTPIGGKDAEPRLTIETSLCQPALTAASLFLRDQVTAVSSLRCLRRLTAERMPSHKRLRSLDEFEPPAWHRRPRPKVLTAPMMLAILSVAVIGVLLGLSV